MENNEIFFHYLLSLDAIRRRVDALDTVNQQIEDHDDEFYYFREFFAHV